VKKNTKNIDRRVIDLYMLTISRTRYIVYRFCKKNGIPSFKTKNAILPFSQHSFIKASLNFLYFFSRLVVLFFSKSIQSKKMSMKTNNTTNAINTNNNNSHMKIHGLLVLFVVLCTAASVAVIMGVGSIWYGGKPIIYLSILLGAAACSIAASIVSIYWMMTVGNALGFLHTVLFPPTSNS